MSGPVAITSGQQDNVPAAPSGRERALRVRVRSFVHDGETYHVRGLTGAHATDEMMALFQRAMGDDVGAGIQLACRLACYCLCEPDGTRWFDPSELDVVRDQMDMGLLNALIEPVIDVSGLAEDLGGDRGN